MVAYLGSPVQFCCGEGETLQTNIAGMCGECSQCKDHTGFAKAQGGMCFLGLHCSGSRVLCRGTVQSGPALFVHFPGLSCSGSWVLHKGTDSFGRAFCAFPRSKQHQVLGEHTVPGGPCILITSLVHAAWYPVCTGRAQSQVCCVRGVSPLGS